MRYFLDTEFVEDGETIKLLSIGIVAEDGRAFYAETPLAKYAKEHPEGFDPWLVENVFPELAGTDAMIADGPKMKRNLLAFCDVERFGKPEFWGYYCDYDWVGLCQIFGRMIDLPVDWPMFCLDLKQSLYLRKVSLPEQTGVEHHALADARWIRDGWRSLYGSPE